MDPDLLRFFRGFLLGAIAIQIVLATVLFRGVTAPLIRRVGTVTERSSRPSPAFLMNETVLRVIMLVLAVAALAFWWYLGTDAGVEYWARSGRRPG